MKVYIVSSGIQSEEYQDRHIDGVFSTQELAEKCLAVLEKKNEKGIEGYEFSSIEEFVLDKEVK